MNSAQRRKAYRALPKPGTLMTFTRRDGEPFPCRVVGKTNPVIDLSSTSIDYGYSGNRPSVHRVRLERLPLANGWTFSPLMTKLHTTRAAA
ncbi:hypothetical protein [Paraburkholderia tropica]|uniref:hypothetical protein n=1 Tax=Paraburkholderia tropica TaxID=92647 RepID=UPI002AB6FACF|nr:hypothetical protein [Paraburkholderia tropica]